MSSEPVRVLYAVSATCDGVLLLYLPIRLRKLYRSSVKATQNRRGILEASLGIALAIFLLVFLPEFLIRGAQYEINFIISLATSVLAAPGLGILLFLEQQRSFKSSDLAMLYLITSILCDVVLLTFPSEISLHTNTLFLVLVRCLMHIVLLAAECYGTRTASSQHQSPEELSGLLSKVFFSWINPVLLQGYRDILIDQDMPPLSHDLKPEIMRKAALQAWDQRAKPETRLTLPLVLLKCVKRPFLAVVIPRLFLIVFRYSQPILIKRSIRFIITPPTGKSHYEYWLIVSAIVVYAGLAISTGAYQHRLNRLKLAIRSALIGLIHNKTMDSPSISYDDGESTTLMNADADTLDGIGEMFHETWAQVLEVAIGITLLAGEVGWIWPLPLFLIFLCSRVSRYVANHLRSYQKGWNNATQSRVAVTSSMISSMKLIKMLGLQNYLVSRIQQLRKEELFAASKLRWMMAYYNASANALGIFSPAITLAIFAIIAKAQHRDLDTETAFATMAILSMVTHPANMVMTIVPRAIGSFAGFDRIQEFLLRPLLRDHRERLLDITLDNSSSGVLTKPRLAIQIQQLTLRKKGPILENVNIDVVSGSITIISGPVGSGKSTLLRAILGEKSHAHGSIKLLTQRIAYCAQKPWLPSGSIREAIYGFSNQVQEEWYHEVLNICRLTYDLASFPDGDQTQIGSMGLNLSGGQRQRVALARAILARCEIVLLDDSFSGLDGETENDIFCNLFGPTSLFRKLKTTVILVSNSTQFFQTADQIIILGDHRVKEQGSWPDIQGKTASIDKFIPGVQSENNTILPANHARLTSQVLMRKEAEVDLTRRTGDLALYGYYFRFIGLINFLLTVGCAASYSFFITTPQYWLQLWSESDGRNSIFYICGFLFLSVMSWLSANGTRWTSVIRLAPKSGLRLHQQLLYIISRAPLSYFSKNENGSILNRFSQDIQLIDKQLPEAVSNMAVQMFKLLMQVIILFLAQKWLTLSLPACILLVYIVQKIYLRTSRQLRFLELESRAAIFSNFLESVEGIETIRSFCWRGAVVRENVERVENSQRPEFLLLSLQRWLNIVLDLLSATIATGVIAIAVAFRAQVSGGQVGVALNIMLVANTTLLRLVENWTTLEISLGAVARLKALEETTPSEYIESDTGESRRDWPSKGGINFKDVTASYHAKSIALRNFNLGICAGQKIIICGRTGSGKSSLILTLLRLLELQSGRIEIDGVDISQVSIDFLRQQCFVTVSQDNLILPNETLRFNLNPDISLPDDVIIDALVKTGVWHHFSQEATTSNEASGVDTTSLAYISANDGHMILDMKISFFQDLSVGQSQLFGLCRALIKANALRRKGVKPVILLDEVTSSLDITTESTIHGIIEKEFVRNSHTVIIVTHKLSVLAKYTIPEKDVVILMRDGRLMEVITDFTSMTLKRIGEDQ